MKKKKKLKGYDISSAVKVFFFFIIDIMEKIGRGRDIYKGPKWTWTYWAGPWEGEKGREHKRDAADPEDLGLETGWETGVAKMVEFYKGQRSWGKGKLSPCPELEKFVVGGWFAS